jgi:glyoxylase-like metal-dependent hydrolase (beta-lactamase superfamily II)
MAKIQPVLHTTPLPPVTSPPGVSIFQLPTGSYRTRAALAFTGGSWREHRDFAATAVLVQHPRGDILIDAGFGAHASEHIRSLPSYRQTGHHLGPTVKEQFVAAGYDESRLLGVVLTHSHWDHVSGLDSLDFPIWVRPEERRYAARSKDDKIFVQVMADHEIREYNIEGPPFLGFTSSYDFHGDGSVVIVPAGGHTPGSVVIFVTPPDGERYAFIGDLAWQLDSITKRVERPLMLRRLADSDSSQVRRDLARMIGLAGAVRMVPAHDARAYEDIPLLTRGGLTTGT